MFDPVSLNELVIPNLHVAFKKPLYIFIRGILSKASWEVL